MDVDSNLVTLIDSQDLDGWDERDLWSLLTVANYWQRDEHIGQLWEGVRDSVRAVINERVRPRLRHLNISDLPDDLLRCVFEYVRGDTGMYELHCYDELTRGKAREIGNVRLTCRRFYETSSHLLIYYINVRLTPQSLSRLHKVSRHPLVSKGIRCVKLSLGPFYDSTLAGDIHTFAAYQAARFRRSIETWEQTLEWQMTDNVVRTEDYQRAIRRAIILAESWEDAAGQGIDMNHADHAILARAHAEYCQQYEQHKSLYDSFAQAIASAMKRIPTATWLEIDDENFYYSYSHGLTNAIFPKDLDEPGSLREKLLSPLDWAAARLNALGPPPFNIIGDLLLSLQKLGIHLKGLDIQTPPPTLGRSNPPTTPDEQELRIAVQQLKAIKFRPYENIWDVYWAERAADEWIPFISFLSHLLHTKSLQKIVLSFYFMCCRDIPPLLSMARILLTYTWPNLKMLEFNGPFHIEELQTVVQRLQKNVEIRWSGYLMSGSWAEVLDLLKEYGSSKTRVGDNNGSIYGQECDEMTQEERDVIFQDDIRTYRGSKATRYIQNSRQQQSNPVSDWENRELVIPEALVDDE